jgi:hypothetical protein
MGSPLGEGFGRTQARNKLKTLEWRSYAGAISQWEIDNTVDC